MQYGVCQSVCCQSKTPAAGRPCPAGAGQCILRTISACDRQRYERGTDRDRSVRHSRCTAADRCLRTGIWYRDYGTPLDAPTHVYHGYVSSAVLLYDAEYIVVEDLEITNEGSMIPGERYSLGEKMNRTGVAVVAKDKGVRSGITPGICGSMMSMECLR